MAEGGWYEDLFDGLPNVEAAQVRLCTRTLLRRPVLHVNSREADLLPLVFRHRDILRRLFASYLGYRLTVERRLARLFKTPDTAAGRGIPNFTPRTYAYLALTMAVLVEAGRQVLLSQLITDIRGAAAEAGITVSDDMVEMRALTAALRYLVAIGVVEETEGTVSALHQRGAAEALITIDTEVLDLVVPRTRLGDASGPSHTSPSGGQPVGILARRRLTEDPVVLYSDLPDTEARYLREHHRQEAYWMERYLGLHVETRAEGMAAIDPEDYLTDLHFPANSTIARMALLILAPLMAAAPPNEIGCHLVSRDQIGPLCADLAARFPSAWAKGEVGNIDTLATRVADHLLGIGLARPCAGNLLLVPGAHRWRPVVEEKIVVAEPLSDEDDPQQTLFDDEEVEF